eukprot:6178496-Pleurochrysis_carterae.AAC.2
MRSGHSIAVGKKGNNESLHERTRARRASHAHFLSMCDSLLGRPTVLPNSAVRVWRGAEGEATTILSAA